MGLLFIVSKDALVSISEEDKVFSYWAAIKGIVQSCPKEISLERKGKNWESHYDWQTNNLADFGRSKTVKGILARYTIVEHIIEAEKEDFEEMLANSGLELIENELRSDKYDSEIEKIFGLLQLKNLIEENVSWKMVKLLSCLKRAEDITLILISDATLECTRRHLEFCGLNPASFWLLACKDRIMEPAIMDIDRSVEIDEESSREEIYTKILKSRREENQEVLALEASEKGVSAAHKNKISSLLFQTG